MATLAQVTHETRLIGKISAVLVVILTAIFFITSGASFVKNTFFPKPPPPPELKYGKLPALSFTIQGAAPTSYIINTVAGTLPVIATDRLNVYKIKKPLPNLLALQSVKDRVSALGFTGGATQLSDIQYQWGTGTVLSYNIQTNDFDLTSGFINNAYAIPPHQLPTAKNQFTTPATGFLSTLQLDSTDIDVAQSPVNYFVMNGTTMNPVDKVYDAQIARVDLFQKDIALTTDQQFNFNGNPVVSMKIYYPVPNKSTMNFILAPDGNGGLRVVEAHYVHQYIDLETSTTYPIKTVNTAYEELKKGNGIITNSGDNSTINITDVQVGYYLGPNQDYLYPIYIFSNGKDFTGYVPAVANTTQ